MKYSKSIRFKLLMLLVAPLLTIAIVYIGISLFVTNRLMFENTVDFVDSAEYTVNSIAEDWRKSTLGFAGMTANNITDDLLQAIKDKDAEKIASLAKPIFDSANCDGMTFADMDGVAISRVTNPSKFGDNIKTSSAIADAIDGLSVSYAYPTTNNGFSVAAGVPVLDRDGTQIAVIFLSKRLDKAEFMDQLSNMSRCNIDLYQGDMLVSSSWREVNTNQPETLEQSVWQTISSGETFDKVTFFGREKVMMRYIPVAGRGGAIVGAIRAIYTYPDGAWIVIVWLVAFALSVGALIPIITPSTVKMVKAIRELSDAAEKMTLGEIQLDVNHTRDDELGILQQSFNRLIDATKHQSQVIEKLAKGDLTISYSARSPKDSIGNNIVLMIENNKEVLSNIADAASRVTAAAHHVADGSQSLASGTSEQSSAIEDISNEMAGIGSKNAANTELTGNAANVSDESQRLMANSMSSMADLVEAMDEITVTSEKISNVIKVIEDIAFKTNMLALNASVEAAHAGQHGMGFAVVASEVRNLAVKSAAATSETSAIIQSNVEKVKHGAAVVEVANDFLKQLADNAEKTNDIIARISEATNSQSESLNHIDTSIKSVVNVIQTNAATAEDSAAASQQMASQAAVLTQLIGKYKLPSQTQKNSDSDTFYLN